jgi:hypothetical protein
VCCARTITDGNRSTFFYCNSILFVRMEINLLHTQSIKVMWIDSYNQMEAFLEALRDVLDYPPTQDSK